MENFIGFTFDTSISLQFSTSKEIFTKKIFRFLNIKKSAACVSGHWG